ncbi:hypothetical protein IMZ48_29515 [Candidatus Bathyarchaeota archaeon]|nr:hypothetical protein [Candidatus Bathyarchaeota archaeon]
MHLVSFRGWPLKEAYQFYLGNKPRLGSDEWVPECRKFNSYLQLWAGNFQVEGRYMPAIREMRRAAGRDVNDSDLPYDPDNDSGDSDWD